MPSISRRLWLAMASALAVCAALAVTYPEWLRAPAWFLVRADAPFQADIVVVTAGEYSGERLVRGAELVRQGLAPRVLVSGLANIYGFHECELALLFAERRGYPRDQFECLRHEGRRTTEEAAVIVAELARRKVHRFILVTSDYHTRRAGSVYRALAAQMDLRVVAAPAPDFQPHDWWRSAASRRRFVTEWTSTVAYWAGL